MPDNRDVLIHGDLMFWVLGNRILLSNHDLYSKILNVVALGAFHIYLPGVKCETKTEQMEFPGVAVKSILISWNRGPYKRLW